MTDKTKFWIGISLWALFVFAMGVTVVWDQGVQLGTSRAEAETAETRQQGIRGGMTIERHVFPEAVCITVAWKEKMGGAQQVRLDCVPK